MLLVFSVLVIGISLVVRAEDVPLGEPRIVDPAVGPVTPGNPDASESFIEMEGVDVDVERFVTSLSLDPVEPRDLDVGAQWLPTMVQRLPSGLDAADEGYEVLALTDTVTALTPRADADRGWGSHLLRLGGTRVHVQVPHPFTDLGTARLGAELFEKGGARHLSVAGARRDALDGNADAAKAENLPFHAVHLALLPTVDLVLQVHGFSSSARPDLEADVVVSAGPGDQGAVAGLVEVLVDAGLSICVPDGSGVCDDLAGRRNIQGISALDAGVAFVHVEIAEGHRFDAAGRALLVEAIANWMPRG